MEMLTNLKKVIFKVFQDMFFLFPEECEEELKFPKDLIKVNIDIFNTENERKSLIFYFTVPIAKMMTENYLGQNDELSEIIIQETLKEAVNVIGGNFLNSFEDSYNLGIPKITEAESDNAFDKILQEQRGMSLEIDSEPFLFLID
jgi:hypothetical protein